MDYYYASDFDYDPSIDPLPTLEQVKTYLDQYIDSFGIRKFIEFN